MQEGMCIQNTVSYIHQYILLHFLLFVLKYFTGCEPKSDIESPWKQLLILEDNKSGVSLSFTEPQPDKEWNMMFSLSHTSLAFLMHFHGTGDICSTFSFYGS